MYPFHRMNIGWNGRGDGSSRKSWSFSCALIELVPVRFDANRVHLIGVLIDPIALFYHGL